MKGKVQDRKEEFIEYAKCHTLEETASFFNIKLQYAKRLRKEWCGLIIPRKTLQIPKEEFITYKKKHGLKKTAEYFGISISTAYNYSSKYGLVCYQKSNENHIVHGHNISEEYPEYAKTHNATECSKHFGVTYSTIRWWAERYKIEPVHKARNLKQVARLLYILDDGKKLYYFVSLDDIATFVGLTRTRVNVLISKESKIHEYNVRKETIMSYRFQGDRPDKKRGVNL